ncbi:predicted protein [Naegleria gruberi]|uniref:Predicted protein n=1 Tax=Naegleria gruberi TaxID=5762 RepID=D2VQK3_NAEGR|nr:uncharacterized protein NAEGRDRAFT_71256 [Naegleria gruberi]EFC40885.1 predicted protein [Naegleria gruberi]|eukprot:XP_002673629.1 predicted protein [Naegleria gruberi strain NEG-M]
MPIFIRRTTGREHCLCNTNSEGLSRSLKSSHSPQYNINISQNSSSITSSKPASSMVRNKTTIYTSIFHILVVCLFFLPTWFAVVLYVNAQNQPFTCGGYLPDDDRVCNFRKGMCIGEDICVCSNGFQGDSCSITTCFGIRSDSTSVCSGSGYCESLNNCTCTLGWKGIACNERVSDRNNQYRALESNNSTISENVDFIEAVITMPNVNQFSSCGAISVDGSSSHSADGRPLIYYWLLFDSKMNLLADNFPHQPIITLESSIPSGSYRVGLIVQNTVLKINSSITVSPIFTKATSPLPMLTMYRGETVIEKYSNEFPITLKKIVSDSSCKSSQDVLHIEWTQLSGPFINHTIDTFNNLHIPKLKVFGNYTYLFRVSTFYKISAKVSLNVTLSTNSPKLELNILQTESTSELTTLQIDYVDPEALYNEESTEVWKWTSSNQSPQLLTIQNLSKSKSLQFSISSKLLETRADSIILTLEIRKSDGRSVQKSTTINFNNIPPLVNIVNIEPPSNVILPGQLIPIQTLTISNSSNTTWILNGKIVDSSSIIQQASPGMETNTILIDSSNLEEGSVNSLTIITYDTKTDDRSQSKIVMYNLGEVYSTKMPSPFTGTSVTCFFDIVDKTTGAFSTTYSNVTIYKPIIQNFADIQSIVQKWEDQSIPYSLDGDFSKSIYQSASTSRTDAVLLKEAMLSNSRSHSRKVSVICLNGVEVSGECKCKDGWMGQRCEISIGDFSNIQGTKLSILRDMMFVVNRTYGMSDEYLSLMSFAMDSLLVNYQFLDTSTISEILNNLNLILDYALSDENVRVSVGVDTLLDNCIESAYKYIKDRQYVNNHTSNSYNLHAALKKVSMLQARSSVIGSTGKSKKGPFFSSVLHRNTVYDFLRSIIDPISECKIVFDSYFFSFSTLSSTIVKKPFVSVLTVSDDVFSLNSRLGMTHKSESQITYSKLISRIVSIDFSELPVQVHGSKISYIIPYNITDKEEPAQFTNLELAEKNTTVSCGDFRSGSPTILRSDCTLQTRNTTHVVCTCVSFTNVFVVETTVVTYHSYVYVLAIVVSSIVACVLFLLIAIGVLVTIIIKIRRNKGTTANKPETVTNTSTFSLRVQEVEIETSSYGRGQTPLGVYDTITPQEKSNSFAVQSVYHMNRKRSQVIPLRIDLLDEKYCDNLSSNGSDCEL